MLTGQIKYNVCLEKGSNQLFVTLYTLSIYPSVHKQLIQTLFAAHTRIIDLHTWAHIEQKVHTAQHFADKYFIKK